MESNKIFCGSAKIVKTQYGELTKVSFNKSDLETMTNHMKSENSDWINLVIKAKKDPKEGKPTHYLEVDTWKASNEPKQAHTPKQKYVSNDSDTLPF